MVHPLVDDPDGALENTGDSHGILGKYAESELIDHLGNTVVDLGIAVIRTTGQYDALYALLLHLNDHLLTLVTDIFLEIGIFLCTGSDSGLCLFLGDTEISESLRQRLGNRIELVQGHEGIKESYALFLDILYVIPDNFGIRTNDGTVIVIARSAVLISLIRDIGIEDSRDTSGDQVLDMTVCELSGIADTL